VKHLDYSIREIKHKDIENGFLDVLSNLSEVGELSQNEALKILDILKINPMYNIYVAVSKTGKVIGATTLLIEQKFIHKGGLVAHIEDVVVKKIYEKQGIGRDLIRKAIETAKIRGCYKVILDCSQDVTAFYEKIGFHKYGLQMRMDLKKDLNSPELIQ